MNTVADHAMQGQPPDQRNASPTQYPQLYGQRTATSTPPAPEGTVADLVHHTNGLYMQPHPQPHPQPQPQSQQPQQQNYCAPNSEPHDCGSQDCGSYDHRLQDHRFQDHRPYDPRSYSYRSYDGRSGQPPVRPGCCSYGTGAQVGHERYSNAWPGEYPHQHPPTTMPRYQVPASYHASQALYLAPEAGNGSVGSAEQQGWYELPHQQLHANSVRYAQPYDLSPPSLCMQQQARQQQMLCGGCCSGGPSERAVLVVMLHQGGPRPIPTSHIPQQRLEAPPPATAETVAGTWP